MWLDFISRAEKFCRYAVGLVTETETIDGDEYLRSVTDEVAEWLRRWTANPLRSTCVGSNPILVDFFHMSVVWNKHVE